MFFPNAGYTNFTVNGTALGQVREFGNFSFVRVSDAGHVVPFCQPRAAYPVFTRREMGLPTGESDVSQTSGTKGSFQSSPFMQNPEPCLEADHPYSMPLVTSVGPTPSAGAGGTST